MAVSACNPTESSPNDAGQDGPTYDAGQEDSTTPESSTSGDATAADGGEPEAAADAGKDALDDGTVPSDSQADSPTGSADATSADAPSTSADGSSTSDGAPADAALDASSDAALDAGIPDGACNALTLVGVPSGNLVASTAAMPAPVGGVITDGTYYGTKTVLYEQEAGAMEQGGSAVWVITGGGTHIEADIGGMSGFSANYDLFPLLDAGSTSVGVTVTCGNGMPVSMTSTWPYSVVTADGGIELSIVPNSQALEWVTFRKQ